MPLRRLRPLLLAACLVLPPALGAQDDGTVRPQPGAIRGTVIDAGTLRELPGTQVTLLPRGGDGALPGTRQGATLANARTAMTSDNGGYAFVNLPAGRYTILVRRMGYDPATVDVTLAASGDTRLSLGLVVLPVRLRPVEVAGDAGRPPIHDSVRNIEAAARIAFALNRQRRFLSTDVREITKADVQEAVTLGSDDVLLALRRLPSATHTSSSGAGMWIRSAPWSQTRVYFDGMPLLNPLGGLGGLTGISSMAIGAAFLHPGTRPVSLGGDGAARIDLQSPPGVADGRLHGGAEASSVGFSSFLARRDSGGRGGFHVAGRRSIGHLVASNGTDAGAAFVSPGATITRFGDLTARADLRLGPAWIEASGLLAYDRRLSAQERTGQAWQLPDSARSNTAAGRVALFVPVERLVTSYAVSRTYSDQIDMRPLARRWPEPGGEGPTLVFAPLTGNVAQSMLEARIASVDTAGTGWSAGTELNIYDTRLAGPRQALYWGDLSTEQIEGSSTLTYASAWGERRWALTPRLEVETGLRVDFGGRGLDAQVRPAPSLLGRYTVTPGTALSLGLARTHQYLQRMHGTEDGSFGAMIPRDAGGPWLVAGDPVPLLRTDHASAGVEQWQPGGHLLTAHVYARRSSGVLVSEPQPGPVVDEPLFVTGRQSATGIEVSARRLAGRLTGMVGYSYGLARSHVGGLAFRPYSGRTHAFDATAMLRLGSVRVGGAFTATSGSPLYVILPGTYQEGDPALGWETPPVAGAVSGPGGATPSSAGLDLMVDWTWRVRRTTLVTFGRLGGLGRCPPGREMHCHSLQEMPFGHRRLATSVGVRLGF